METISRSLLTFLVNSLWQVPLVGGVAALACRFLRKDPASHRHAVWVAGLAAALLLPLGSIHTAAPSDKPRFDPALAVTSVTAASPVPHTRTAVLPAATPLPARTVSFGATWALVLLGAYFLFALFRLARLAWACIHTLRIRRTAGAGEIPLLLDRVRARCQEAFGLSGVELLFSAQVSGPVAAGCTVILPESLLREPSEDVLTTAIGHEMAHIARRDFGGNFLYELLYLPISFHPAAWLIRRGIERTREMACDELVTRRLMDAGVYARSIVSIAAQMAALPCPGYTLGVFDGDILEERIRRLIETPAANRKRARWLLAGGLAALALCTVMASNLALTARAQGAASDMMKQAQAALARGDYKTAAGLFQSAVNMEPDNLEAKLSLGGALLEQYIPGTEPASPLLAGARKQYQDVLARDPGNKQAIKNMMALSVDSKQYAEAREWAQKAIAVDSTDPAGYYTAGVVDWMVTYPDYARARTAAGMNMADPGIIPDAGLRQNLRSQHEAQIEDGFRMLQSALQLDPQDDASMAYMNLLYRIQAGIADNDAEYKQLIAQADDWVGKALEAKSKKAAAARQAGQPVQSNSQASLVLAPPPPPPPPPGTAAFAASAPPGTIRVEGLVQQSMLLTQKPPVYPAMAAQSGITGTVTLGVLIGKDGTVQNIQVIKGHPLLVAAAIDAVKQWTYKPTLLNGEPVEVLTSVNVTFEKQ